ncbi:MAG: 2-C-methyl-D-erythritol 2,4-cyclodiphosphate synthase [Actinomycetota bacterium]|nr:2-C-methyl-D-erythritol 2,4-cyclodiphosphate synthase [Actinomycetota bacterium]
MRVGFGYDVHAFDESRELVLGGVSIPDAPGLSGHSDADVVSHAIADALLGAARLGDLGTLFPNDDRWAGASSLEILSHTAKAVSDARWSIVNVDATVVAQMPKLAPYREEMIDVVAASLGLATSAVWIKGTTTDGLGFTGRTEGIAAMAVVLIERPDAPIG